MNQDIWRIENALDSASLLLLSSIVSELIATRFCTNFCSCSSALRVTSVPGHEKCPKEVYRRVGIEGSAKWHDMTDFRGLMVVVTTMVLWMQLYGIHVLDEGIYTPWCSKKPPY